MKNTQIVTICTPTADGKVEAWYVNSLYETILLCAKNNIVVKPIFLAYESILPMARNECFKIAFDEKFTDMIFIDADIGWTPTAFLETVTAREPVIGLPCRLKTDESIMYNVKFSSPDTLVKNAAGYIKAVSVGAGFLKISRPVIEALWASNVALNFKGKQLKYICEYGTTYADFIGEDITLCTKIKELGYDIWVNPKHTCLHVGVKVYGGDFLSYFNGVNEQTNPASRLTEENKSSVTSNTENGGI